MMGADGTRASVGVWVERVPSRAWRWRCLRRNGDGGNVDVVRLMVMTVLTRP